MNFFAELLLDDEIHPYEDGIVFQPDGDSKDFCKAVAKAKNLHKSDFMSDIVLHQFISELIDKFVKDTE